MKLLTRWKASITSTFEHVLNQVENHEAVIATAICETREAAAGARVKLNRIRRDTERMRQRITELQAAEKAWASRAVQVHSTDQEKALECVRRRNAATREIQHLEDQLARHKELDLQLSRDIVLIEERIAELERRRNAYSAREFRAKALSIHEACGTSNSDVEDVFDRWEVKLAATEPMQASTSDPLETEFAAEEERAALEAQLDELLRSAPPRQA